MPDFIDQLQDNDMQQILLEEQLKRISAKVRPVVITHHCFNCGEKTPGRNFCDSDCQEDYEKRQPRTVGRG